MAEATPLVKPAYSPGLDGVIAGESAICEVHANAGLLYRGYDINVMATLASFEEIVYLLLYGELPNRNQLNQIQHQISSQHAIPESLVKMLRLMPKAGVPMDVLRT